MVGWNNLFWIGAGYRSSNNQLSTSALMFTAAVEIKRQVFVGYTFEIGVDGQLNNSLGTQHEFMVGIRFGGDNKLKELEGRIEKLEKQDSLFKEDVAVSRAKEADLQAQIDSLNSQVNDQQNTQMEQGESLRQQGDLLKLKEKEIINNTREIEKLKELIKNNPMMYKKIGSVYFDKGSDKITEDSEKILALIKDAIAQEDKSITVYLYGNASIEGDQTRNMSLSTKRTIAVRKALIRIGVPNEVIVLPMGEENPKKGGQSDVNEADRRVDIILGEKKKMGKL